MAMFENHRILVPLDGSELSERALPYALELARKFNARIILLRCMVLSSIQLAPDLLPASHEQELEALEREQITLYLDAIRQRDDLRDRVEAIKIPAGAPGEEILEFAQSEHVDLIVMTSHGRSGFGRFVYGSVAEKVLHHTPCPILLIRPS